MTECAYPCTGDADLFCGGFDAFQVFSLAVDASLGHLGCYADMKDDRLFRAGKIDLDINSVEVSSDVTGPTPFFPFAVRQGSNKMWIQTRTTLTAVFLVDDTYIRTIRRTKLKLCCFLSAYYLVQYGISSHSVSQIATAFFCPGDT